MHDKDGPMEQEPNPISSMYLSAGPQSFPQVQDPTFSFMSNRAKRQEAVQVQRLNLKSVCEERRYLQDFTLS